MVFMIAQDLQLCIDEGHSNSKDIFFFFLPMNLLQHPHEIDLNKETNVSCLY